MAAQPGRATGTWVDLTGMPPAVQGTRMSETTPTGLFSGATPAYQPIIRATRGLLPKPFLGIWIKAQCPVLAPGPNTLTCAPAAFPAPRAFGLPVLSLKNR